MTHSVNESLNDTLTHSPPSRASADQGAGNRERSRDNCSEPTIHPTTRTSTHETPTLDGRTNIRDISAPVAASPSQEERPTTDQSQRPVSPVVARDRSEIWALCDAATPGPWRLSEQQGNWIWPHIANTYGSRREDAAFIAAARELVPALLVELERTEGDLAVTVREANHHRTLVAEAVRLHQADAVDPDWCAACQTSAWPCPTAAALGCGSDA